MPSNSDPIGEPIPASASRDIVGRIVAALMALASERGFDEITLTDIVARADISLGQFREHYVSKGAVLAGFMRQIDLEVLNGAGEGLAGEPAKERLFDVLMRRLDALKPYRAGLENIGEWARREPLAAIALSRPALNSMRFMLEAADIDTSGSVGALKLRGLAMGWSRVLEVWFRDDDPGLAKTMAALDRMLVRGGHCVARAEDAYRLTSPLRSLARGVFDRRHSFGERVRERWPRRRDDDEPVTEDRL